LLILIGVSFVFFFLFFAGVQRFRRRREDSIPEEYLTIISDFPPEFFVPFQPPKHIAQLVGEEEQAAPEVQPSALFRLVQYIGYQTAKIDSKLKPLQIPKKILRAKLAYKVADILGLKRSAKIAGKGYKIKRKLVAKTQG